MFALFLAIIRRGSSFGGLPGLIFSNGKTWMELRRSSLHALRDFGFGKDALEDIIEDEVNNLILYIENHWLNQPLDVSQFFNVAVLASLWRIISGESLKLDDPKLEQILTNLRIAISEGGHPLYNLSLRFIPLFLFLNRIGVLKTMKAMNEIFDFCSSVIQKHKVKGIDGENPLTFVEALLHKIDQTTDPSKPLHGSVGETNLLNILIDFFIAGSDTTSTTLNWAMLYMIRNSDVQDKVREEIQLNIGSRKARMDDRTLTPYTEAVLLEISRKADIVPFSIFHCTVEDLKVNEFNVPRDSIIIPSIGGIMKDPIDFPNPEKFDPERFLSQNSDGTMKFTPHLKVVPFGIGKRRCLGEVLARVTLYKFFTSIIQKFQIVSGQDKPVLDESNGAFIQSPLPYKLKFLKVNE